ncbi:hypothetical protein [Paraclostridium sp. AKS81]|nr:hypothetical protein [Paraclostridium sp. AKS81]MCU9811167.1 hypothetical protein [Paraclostridium sp. AKS81]
MIIDKYETSIINTIKSFNEIVSNFTIVTSNKCLEVTELKNIGAKIIYSDDKDLNLLIEKCKSKYIFMVDIGEICSTLSQKKIIELLSNTNEKFFTVNIVNIANNTNCKEVRIIKNENSNFINEYKYALIKNKNVVDSNIYIHKSFN